MVGFGQFYKGSTFRYIPEIPDRALHSRRMSKGGIVLDPFFGSGTTGIVATEHNRDYIGIELNPEYIEIANRRLSEIQIQLF